MHCLLAGRSGLTPLGDVGVQKAEFQFASGAKQFVERLLFL